MTDEKNINKEAQNQETAPILNNPKCAAFCPVCGADLYMINHECICKNKECLYRCSSCVEPDDV